jgi:hypothetical protein
LTMSIPNLYEEIQFAVFHPKKIISVLNELYLRKLEYIRDRPISQLSRRG